MLQSSGKSATGFCCSSPGGHGPSALFLNPLKGLTNQMSLSKRWPKTSRSNQLGQCRPSRLCCQSGHSHRCRFLRLERTESFRCLIQELHRLLQILLKAQTAQSAKWLAAFEGEKTSDRPGCCNDPSAKSLTCGSKGKSGVSQTSRSPNIQPNSLKAEWLQGVSLASWSFFSAEAVCCRDST